MKTTSEKKLQNVQILALQHDSQKPAHGRVPLLDQIAFSQGMVEFHWLLSWQGTGLSAMMLESF